MPSGLEDAISFNVVFNRVIMSGLDVRSFENSSEVDNIDSFSKGWMFSRLRILVTFSLCPDAVFSLSIIFVKTGPELGTHFVSLLINVNCS